MELSGLLDALTWGRVLGCCLLLVITGFVIDYATLPRYPEGMPAVGYGHGLWAHLRSNIAYFSSQRAWINEGYVKVGIHDHATAGAQFEPPTELRPLTRWCPICLV